MTNTGVRGVPCAALAGVRMLGDLFEARVVHGWLQPRRSRQAHAFSVQFAPTREESPLCLEVPSLFCGGRGAARMAVEAFSNECPLLRLPAVPPTQRVATPTVHTGIWVPLTYGSHDFGVLRIERDSSVVPGAVSRAGRELLPLISAGVRAELEARDTETELSVQAALGAKYQRTLLFSRENRRVTWTSWVSCGCESEASTVGIETLLDATISEPRLSQRRQTAGLRWVELGEYSDGAVAVGLCALEQPPEARLSPRERQVSTLLAEGYAIVNIAAVTGLSEHTVRTYARRVYRKLGVHSRASLVRRLLEQSASNLG
ncbi:MAG TPA: helix-turn-helix transcriptional regulator [Polyangiaceae bacterium]|nr:helix-turn-helix transcriptional regulator [Polyangiaceae bacterium]